MISVDEALERILSAIRPLGSETVALPDSLGRIAAADVRARLFNPAFDVSAMDGYAVRAADVHPGATLQMIGTSQAGARFDGAVGPGQCVRIFTGAPVPPGADAVVMQEETRAEGAAITFEADVLSGRSIRYRGEDFAEGDVLAAAGAAITPNRLALIAAGNVSELAVARRPSIGILATGDELVPLGHPVGPDQIVASNSLGLAAFFAPHAGPITDHGIAPDSREALGAALARALDAEPDILITTGGASVGEHDLVQEMLKAKGVAIDFWRIAMRPGKPLMFGRRGKTLVFGLPGNPVSSLVTARIFVLPAVLALVGARPPAPQYLPLAADLGPNAARRHFLRGRLISDPDLGTAVEPVRQIDSGHLSSVAGADVLIVHKEHSSGLKRGHNIEVQRF
ncbi:molybdopterin molybdotransferase MoeA [Pelagibacterium lacus]|uniref:Molybdopterin molybdenumtransferase n=1 Tax=Pelagibacterium lacus TaxID=2282655 RepID=A0A369W7C9_9HYPH|nr:gephyrin-like molybdotransferase Glp [Pelagibacterium lacus]RDE07971.1 molybdopterin molybdenumtransferase MoeA [Pelagibacterium lacus]